MCKHGPGSASWGGGSSLQAIVLDRIRLETLDGLAALLCTVYAERLNIPVLWQQSKLGGRREHSRSRTEKDVAEPLRTTSGRSTDLLDGLKHPLRPTILQHLYNLGHENICMCCFSSLSQSVLLVLTVRLRKCGSRSF